MKRRIRIGFSDFWPGFDPANNYFTKLLSTVYELEICSKPDFLFHSVFGLEYLKYSCIRILYTAENIKPDFFESDYAFSFAYDAEAGRNFRFPYYGWRVNPDLLVKPENLDLDKIYSEKTNFCNMVVSNANAKERIDFFYKLSKYKKVDSGGRYLNNIGGPVADKVKFISSYKFTIAFENTSAPGYTTEKITEPMLVNSLPVYWGNPRIDKDFNSKSFLNVHEFGNVEEAIERIIEIDNNRDLYYQYLSAPYFYENKVNDFVSKERILEKLVFIVENGKSHTNFTKSINGVYAPYKKLRVKLSRIKGIFSL